jgi:hypothetical protein
MKVRAVVVILTSVVAMLGMAFAGEITLTYHFPLSDLSFSKMDSFDLVSLKGCGFMTETPGTPMLPQKAISVLVPAGAKVLRVSSQVTKHADIPGQFLVFPIQPPAPLSANEPQVPVAPDPAVYDTTATYPQYSVSLSGQGSMCGFRIASLLVNPVEYLPRDRKLRVVADLEVRIEYSEGVLNVAGNTQEQNRVFGTIVSRLVDNARDLARFAPHMRTGPAAVTTLPSGNYPCVTISNATLGPSFQPLIDWRTRRGVRDTLVTLEYIYGHYPGYDYAEQIRNFLIDARNSWGTIYALLGGMCNFEHGRGVVPRRDVWFCNIPENNSHLEGDTIPCDLYFSDLEDVRILVD